MKKTLSLIVIVIMVSVLNDIHNEEKWQKEIEYLIDRDSIPIQIDIERVIGESDFSNIQEYYNEESNEKFKVKCHEYSFIRETKVVCYSNGKIASYGGRK